MLLRWGWPPPRGGGADYWPWNRPDASGRPARLVNGVWPPEGLIDGVCMHVRVGIRMRGGPRPYGLLMFGMPTQSLVCGCLTCVSVPPASGDASESIVAATPRGIRPGWITTVRPGMRMQGKRSLADQSYVGPSSMRQSPVFSHQESKLRILSAICPPERP